MHLKKEDIPVRLEAPGATARQLPDFGRAAGTLGAEYPASPPVRTSRLCSSAWPTTCATPPTGGT